ncbi:flagellar P-ring protein precursor FlgI [Sphingobium sp. B1D7B]|nr:flagellar P-ring protein precursor FlgI [Sphingobium sp. B12D2B]MCW2362071.1 flagellar P-ring protein precursor FlgI [Sphingobium sp. B10D3B]MCW2366135.1 flagellar P-ring protein precursor FlgI [Sphingobium sp. B7D2B]MCW2369757.1 flagellar P-ring protein precursor FlgI [Sphingobium sp. B11D3D]MCW2390503.1 flagellar P-ring protein precursor FlgI [Sphingobium sp. B11D3A]MCW2394803.1 flagellar P-ring protein precursor FlgI [Sphingobium sp. B8D3B]MCW2401250.1 flagellar P-ring protein precursor
MIRPYPSLLRRLVVSLALLAFGLCLMIATSAHAQRIKDIGTFEGLRSNQLVGYGVVVGLAGTGDDSLDYATQGVKGVISRFGLTLPPGVNPSLKNAAAVLVTAELPAFAKPGQRLDVTVSALGKAKSLRGGTLVLTPMRGADGEIYAMAQGNMAVGGFGVSGADGSQLSVNVPSAGRIPSGASVERAVATGFETSPTINFNLAEADVTTALRVADAINLAFGDQRARAVDGVSIAIDAPPGAESRVMMMGLIENIQVKPADPPAKVIVNARSGTVVINGNVQITPAAVSHGKLTVTVTEAPRIVQPAPLSRGVTAVEESSQLSAHEEKNPMFLFKGGASLADIVKAVNAVGASPSDLLEILSALKQAGAMRAELEVI